MLTTNGLKVRSHWGKFSKTARVAGLNIIIVDLYEPYGPELRSEIEDHPNGWQIVDFYRDGGFSPWYNHGAKGNVVVFMDDIRVRSGEKSQRTIFNHAGNGLMGKKLEKPLDLICTNPFREVAVQYDGSVPICCMDYGREYIVGNLADEPLQELWYSERWMAVRRILFERRRPMAPCCRCDHPSGPRVGLIPKQDAATEDDELLAYQVNAASPRINGREPEWCE
jgi:radical SAM protein with 4Fe4S-binding SPASM domain